MNKRKERDQEDTDEQKRRALSEFKVQLTMDVGEARGYLYAGLVENNALLKALFKLFAEGNQNVKYMGDPLASELERFFFDTPRHEDDEQIYFQYFYNMFYVDSKPRDTYSIPAISMLQLRTLIYNKRPAVPPAVQETPQQEPPPSTQVEEDNEPIIEPPPMEIDKFDLKAHWDSMDANNSSVDDKFAMATKFVEDFRDSTSENYANRDFFKFNSQSMWRAMRLKIEALSKDETTLDVIDLETNVVTKKTAPIFVYFDALSGNMFASVNASLARNKTIKIFSTHDLLMSFAMKVHDYTRETDFYEENVEKLRQIGVTANLFYQGKRFTAVLVEQYPELQQNDIYTPYAVVFYPSICRFARFKSEFSLEEQPYIDLAQRVRRAQNINKAILIKETYTKIASEFGWVITDNIEPSEEDRKTNAYFEAAIARGTLPNVAAENPRVADSATIWHNKSPYSELLNSLYLSELVPVAVPRTQSGELLYMAMIVYRQFVDNANLYEKTVSAYRFFEYTEGLRAEKAIQYCAEKNELNRTDVGVSRLAVGYERFMIDCIILAADENMRVETTADWESRVPFTLKYMIGSGDLQGALQNTARKYLPPFGDLETDRLLVLRDTINQCTDAAFGVSFDGTAEKFSYAKASTLESNIERLVLFELSRELNDIKQKNSKELDIFKCDVELIDDLLFHYTCFSLPQVYVGDNVDIRTFVDEQLNKSGRNIVILFDKHTRKNTVLEFSGGPIALREALANLEDVIILYSAVKPVRRLREVLLPVTLRKRQKSREEIDDDNENGSDADERERIRKQAEEANRRRGESGPGSFANVTHVHQDYIEVVRRAMYPAQIQNTVWREMMNVGVTVYRKFTEFPRAEDKIGARSVFNKLMLQISMALITDSNKEKLLSLIKLARLRLLWLLQVAGERTASIQEAYDRFLDELLGESIKKADVGELLGAPMYVKSARKYAINQGRYQNTLEYLYMNYYKHVGPVPEKNKRFVDVFNKFVDEPSVTDEMFSNEILVAFGDLVPRNEKDLELQLFPAQAPPIGRSAMIRELLDTLKEKAPLFFNDAILSATVSEALKLLPRGAKPQHVVAIHQPEKQPSYALAIVPQAADDKTYITFTNGTKMLLSWADVKLVFAF